jgi:hypothetical protein
MGDDDSNVDGDGATGNEVDNDGDGAMGDDDDDGNADDNGDGDSAAPSHNVPRKERGACVADAGIL